MQSSIFFEFASDDLLRGTLIVINLLLLISLLIRFEWPLIQKKLQRSKQRSRHTENNVKFNVIGDSTHQSITLENEEKQFTLENEEEFTLENEELLYNKSYLEPLKSSLRASAVSIKNMKTEEEKYFNNDDDLAAHTFVTNKQSISTHNVQYRERIEFYKAFFSTSVHVNPNRRHWRIQRPVDHTIPVLLRYRYILYFPQIIFILSGVAHWITNVCDILNYGFPIYEIILSLSLWCTVDVVVLSCGGSMILHDCLEVQTSLNGYEYKCVYCCWCDLSILKAANCCTYDNQKSLFLCHWKFMKIVITMICPLLIVAVFIITENLNGVIPVNINEHLTMIKIGDISDFTCDFINDLSLYSVACTRIVLSYSILIFTATYIG
eukprot:383859_1